MRPTGPLTPHAVSQGPRPSPVVARERVAGEGGSVLRGAFVPPGGINNYDIDDNNHHTKNNQNNIDNKTPTTLTMTMTMTIAAMAITTWRACVRGAKKCAYASQGIWLLGGAVCACGAKSVRMPRRVLRASAVPVRVPRRVLGEQSHACRCRGLLSCRQRSGRHSLAPCPCGQRGPHEPPTPLSLPLSSLYSTPCSLSATRVCGDSLYPGGLPPPPFFLPWGGGKRGPGALAGPNCAFRGTPCAAFQHVQGDRLLCLSFFFNLTSGEAMAASLSPTPELLEIHQRFMRSAMDLKCSSVKPTKPQRLTSDLLSLPQRSLLDASHCSGFSRAMPGGSAACAPLFAPLQLAWSV